MQAHRPSTNFQSYPFAAIVGHSRAKLGLMLLAVDRQLRGLLLTSASGTAKTALSRAAQAIFQSGGGEESDLPFVVLPLGVTPDRLLGGLDFEQSLLSGKRQFARGLLAEAHGGVLLVDDLHLLEAGHRTQIAAALDSRTLPVERDGLSVATGADFVLLGMARPGGGEVSALLRQRVGLMIESDSLDQIEERAEIIRRVVAYQENPDELRHEFEAETRRIVAQIEQAKIRLPRVKISVEDLRRLALVSMRLGIEGNQADIFAARAAKASAALAGQETVSEADLISAIQLVLVPRASQLPIPEVASEPRPRENGEPPVEPAPPKENPPAGQDSERLEESLAGAAVDDRQTVEENRERQRIDIGSIEELLIKSLDADLPRQVLQAMAGNRKTAKPSASGKRGETADQSRGRSVSHSARKTTTDKIAIVPTLRAAAPYQVLRRRNATGPSAVKITADDLRYKRFKKKSAMLFIFAVDASGSMALNRMAQAKGAMTRLLQEAYIHRDKVSLISFRRDAAELLLPPTRSVELAKRVVEALPTGGATPVAAALLKALEVAKHPGSAEISQTLLILFTDGRANAGLQVDAGVTPDVRAAAIKNELRQLGIMLQAANISSMVMDTKVKFLAAGEAQKLAELIGANYCYLPRADDQEVFQSVSNLAKTLRNS